MNLSKHAQSSHHISYPMSSELAPCFSSPELVSPPNTPPRGHKHTLSKPMSWLSRSSSSTSSRSIPRAAPKPTRISEPKLGSSLEQYNIHRSGPLGSGATIVRTPQEALSSSIHPVELITEEESAKKDSLLYDAKKDESRLLPPLRPTSPPLPPLPDVSDAETEARQSPRAASILLSDHVPHPRSSSSPSPPPNRSSSRPTLLVYSHALSRSMLALPAEVDSVPSQPPFEAILLSSISDGAIEPSKIIVTLETCTTTYRTSLRSLISRPSYLSRYIASLLSPPSETASIYSNASGPSLTQHSDWFNSVFRDHLASSGCLPPSSTGIHLFLDRPSAPYTHVLAYLRSLPSTPDQPETLPRAVQLGSTSPSPLASLLELRDEASYLGLVQLHTLCCHEIDRFHCAAPSVTSAAVDGMPCGKSTGSVHSFHTLVEQCQPHTDEKVRSSELQALRSDSGIHTAKRTVTRKSGSSSLGEIKDVPVRERSRQQWKSIKYEMGTPPPGWI